MIFFDTSVLIAASYDGHPHYPASHKRLIASQKSGAACAAHTIAEIYGVVSRLAGTARQNPEEAMLLIDSLLGRLNLITLTANEYIDVIRKTSDAGLSGGIIYDALLLACARKAKARTIYTWNLRHFRAVAPDLAGKITEP